MKQITEKQLKESVNRLRTAIKLVEYDTNINNPLPASLATSHAVGGDIHNFTSNAYNNVGNLLRGMVGQVPGQDYPLFNSDDGSYYFQDSKGNTVPITPENAPDFIRGNPKKHGLPYYNSETGDFYWRGLSGDVAGRIVPVGDLFKEQNKSALVLPGAPETSFSPTEDPTSYEEGTTALEAKTARPVIWYNGKWEYVK